MKYERYILDAIDLVLNCDVPDEDFAHVVNQQTKLMSGMNPDEPWEDHMDTN